MTDILGVNPLDPAWSGADSSTSDALSALDALVSDRLAARTAARSARDYATSDAIRDQLVAAGITIEDTSTGARWSLTRGRGE
jgi:cysteinyl-tRNA synthetase